MWFSTSTTLQKENFHWNLNFAIFRFSKLLILNSAYYYIFKNTHSIIFNSVNLTSQARSVNYPVFIFILFGTVLSFVVFAMIFFDDHIAYE